MDDTVVGGLVGIAAVLGAIGFGIEGRLDYALFYVSGVLVLVACVSIIAKAIGNKSK